MIDRRAFPVPAIRRVAVVIVVGVLMGLPVAIHAATPPTGTISCNISSQGGVPPGAFFFLGGLTEVPRNTRVLARTGSSTCDASAVVNGKAPILSVKMKFTGTMRDATCGSFTTTPVFEKGRLQLKWVGLNAGGHTITVSVNNLQIASTSYDTGTHQLIVTSMVIAKGAFLGKTAVMRVGFDDPGFEVGCADTFYGGVSFGNVNPATVVVQ